MTDGTLYGTGYNYNGELGLGNNDSVNVLTLIPNTTSKTPKYVTCGGSNTVVLMTDGTLYGTGYNYNGCLGLGNDNDVNVLTLIPNTTSKTPKYVACGEYHTIVLMTDGTLYGTGSDIIGQLGILDSIQYKYNVLTLIPNKTSKTPKYVTCGIFHTVVLMTDGTLYVTGDNWFGQLGLGNDNDAYVLTRTSMNNVIYMAGMMLSDDLISDICFPAGTLIQTDQGNIAIEKINPDINTINGAPIVDITKTITNDEFLVEFQKNALGSNYPADITRISKNHKLYYNGTMQAAHTFIGKFKTVGKVKYNGEILYNVLMRNSSKMRVNNLICETLDPNNIIAKLYTRQFKYTHDVRDKIVVFLEECLQNNDYKTYRKVLQQHC